jgi:hypothetical protein
MAKNEEVLLTEKEVWDVVKFANAMSDMFGKAYLSPAMINSRMKDLNLNPKAATEALLNTAMQDPKGNEEQLRQFSQNFELSSMVYKRLLTYLSNMLAFDITYTNNGEKEDYSKPRFQRDSKSIEKFLDDFDYKKEFRIVVREMLRNDAYFGIFRKAGEKHVLQELPVDYCKITGRWSNGFLFSFNLHWFIQPGVDINMYPDFFKEKYNEYFNKAEKREYNPTLSPEARGDSSWGYWVDIPTDIGVCFKLTPELATQLPYFTPLFSDLVLQSLMRNLQKNVNMANASKLIMGQVPLLDRDVKATVKDTIAISPDLLGKFMALVKTALSDSVNIASAPLEDLQEIEFEANNDLYDKYLRTALASSGINTNLIFSSDIKPNVIETQLSLNVDEQMMSSTYEQFEDFMNYFANKETEYFKYSFRFEGTNFDVNRDKRLDYAMRLFDKGIVLPQKIAAAIGIKPHHLRRHMIETDATNFMDLLKPPSVEMTKQMQDVLPQPEPNPALPNNQSQSTEEVKRGRPQSSETELGEEGSQTRATGSNISKGGEV